MNKNLLNNQNYILWNIEKKKLLSKFFIEKNFRQALSILNLVSNVIFNWKSLFLAPIVIYIYLYFHLIRIESMKVFFWIILWIFSLIFFITFWFQDKKINKHKISKIKDFFLKKWTNANAVFVLWFIKLLIFYPLLIFLLASTIRSVFIPDIVKSLIFIVVFIWGLFILLRINLLNTLLFPFLVVIGLWIAMFSTVYIFIIKWISWYYIIKYYPWTKFLDKFKKFNKSYAESNYYRIELKK